MKANINVLKLTIPMIGLLFCTVNLYAQEESPIIRTALSYLYTPYVAHTLDNGAQEHLVVNKREVDCTTFVEYVLAEVLTRSPKNIDRLSEQDILQKIRYRDGIIAGYPSRLHYASEWIEEGIKNGYLVDITQKYAQETMYVVLSYMTDHPSFYKNLKDAPENVAAMKQVEQEASGKLVHYLPKDKVSNQGAYWIKQGDIICFTTGIYGLDISHMGFAYYKNNRLHLLHASYPQAKVIIDSSTIREMLIRNKRWTGIRVLRPQI